MWCDIWGLGKASCTCELALAVLHVGCHLSVAGSFFFCVVEIVLTYFSKANLAFGIFQPAMSQVIPFLNLPEASFPFNSLVTFLANSLLADCFINSQPNLYILKVCSWFLPISSWFEKDHISSRHQTLVMLMWIRDWPARVHSWLSSYVGC